ncbi:MAG: Single-stranded-DNA-specific exonuclease RecJ [Verrucomicrobiae bacterium]|nr:Single-stranded-DNA-specific exonuclease RecJ [Verrucomicrobiae bacterium]
MNKRWLIAPVDPARCQTLASELALPVPLAQTLINRGFDDVEAARRFLNPQLRQLGDPFALPAMLPAVERILAALDQGERIVIYGDYDVDGVTSSALLGYVLRAAGGAVTNFLPHRLDEGYGLSAAGIARCRQEHNPQLLIAVDCGTSSRAEIAGLTQAGIDVIVLDHHEPPAELPECVALVNPKCGAAEPFASVGLAFKLAHALLKQRRELSERIDLREHLDLVALGTVADIVPLVDENRILVKAGLERLPVTKKVGLRALLEVAGVEGEVSPYHIGFRLGPRLNAAGRLADAMAALELVLTGDAGRAAELAAQLDEQNAERQQLEDRTLQAALRLVDERDRVFVVADEGWHPGVIGIVASRLAQRFYRPTVVIGQGGKGSGRSVTGFSLVAALTGCAELLVKFGGHEMAAGLTIEPGRVAALRERLNAQAGEWPGPMVRIDAVVKLGELTREFVAAVAQFEPCGAENPAPVFAALGVRLAGKPRVVGQKHLKFAVTDGTATVEAIGWGMGDWELPAGGMEIAFVAEMNEFRGVESVQLKVRDLRAGGAV